MPGPKNQNMPISLKILEVGRIIMAGLSAIGALALGEVIENVLLPIPVLAVEIPLIGSLASIIGIFLGTVVAGLIGAIVINLFHPANPAVPDDLFPCRIKRLCEILFCHLDFRIIFSVSFPHVPESLKVLSGRCLTQYRDSFFK